jgi:hypothetical protein
LSEKATFIESSRGKPMIIRNNYKYFLAYKLKSESGLSRWRCCLTICQAVIYINKTEEIVAVELHKNLHNHLPPPKKKNKSTNSK